VKLYAFHCGGEGTDMAFFSPFDVDVGTKVVIPYLFYLIEHEKGLVLFDCGPHEQLVDDPAVRLGGTASTYAIKVEKEDLASAKLISGGWDPKSIAHVFLSHLHYDHAGGTSQFPQAVFHVQKSELKFAFEPPIYQRGDYVKEDYESIQNLHELDGEFDLFGDGKIIAIPTPGHTPGHQSLYVKLDNQVVVLVGDAAPYESTIDKQTLPAVLWNPDSMVSSWKRLRSFRDDEGALLLFPHDPNFKKWMRVFPEGFYS